MKKIPGIIFFICVCLINIQAQTVITGKVTDEDGVSMPGASVLLKGTMNGTVTNVEGNFTLTVPDQNSVLQITFVGYLQQEITVGNQTVINVVLQPDVMGLEEVVVIGYGTVSKQNLTTSIVKVDPKEVPKAANSSISELLVGKAAGLRVVQQSAEPGGEIDLSIRGRDNPLIVVDGVIYPGSALEPDNGKVELQGVNRGGIAGLNPNDIESIEVLKDASASIYGVSAANGVILITTKKGASGKMNVSYDGSRSSVTMYNYLEPLNAKDYMTYFNQIYQDQYYYDRRMVPFGVTPQVGFNVPYSDSIIALTGEGTDWLDQIVRPGSIDNHSLTISGGTENVTYYFSGNYFNQKGILEHSGVERYNVRSNVSYKLAKFLSLNTSLNMNRNFYINSGSGWQAGGSGTQGYGGLQAALAYDPNLPVRNADGTYSQFSVIPNPVSMLDITDKTVNGGLFATFSLDIDIVPNLLKARLLYGNNNESANRDFYIPSDVYWGMIYQSRGSNYENKRQNQTMESILTLNKKIGDAFGFEIMAGAGRYRNDYSTYGIEFTDVLDATNTVGIESALNSSIYSDKSVDKKLSYFSRANFTVLDRYLVMLAVRYDGYDKFFPENKYAAFPSASIGWKLSNEPFLENIKFINMLKLRASYGTTGSEYGTTAMGQVISDKNGTRQVSAVFDDGQTIYPLYVQTALDQPELEWEKTINKNIGIDFSLFKSRFSGTLEWFRDDKPNLIYTNAPTPSLSAIQTYPVNDGHTYRKGYEVALRTINMKTNSLEWTTDLNISHYEYNWMKRSTYTSLTPYQNETDPVNAIYVYETDGIIQIGDTIFNYYPTDARRPGCPVFVDKDGNDTLDSRDVTMYNYDPKIIIGMGNTFKIKNFDLTIFVYGQFGAYDWNNSYAWADPGDFAGGVQNGSQSIKEVWTTSNPDGTIPGVAWDESVLGLNASVDTWLTKKDFVRFRNITLGYTFNSAFLKKYVSDLRIYFDAQNPFIITKYVGGDPETNFPKPRVSSAAPHPMIRSFSLGVNANF